MLLTEIRNAGNLVWRARIAAVVNQPPQKGHQGPFMALKAQPHGFEVAIKCYLQLHDHLSFLGVTISLGQVVKKCRTIFFFFFFIIIYFFLNKASFTFF